MKPTWSHNPQKSFHQVPCKNDNITPRFWKEIMYSHLQKVVGKRLPCVFFPPGKSCFLGEDAIASLQSFSPLPIKHRLAAKTILATLFRYH